MKNKLLIIKCPINLNLNSTSLYGHKCKYVTKTLGIISGFVWKNALRQMVVHLNRNCRNVQNFTMMLICFIDMPVLIPSLISSETDLLRNQAIQNQRNSFSRGFPLPFNVETLQAFGALFQIPHYYRKFLYCKPNMLCT
jgi:hypothetical protein